MACVPYLPEIVANISASTRICMYGCESHNPWHTMYKPVFVHGRITEHQSVQKLSFYQQILFFKVALVFLKTFLSVFSLVIYIVGK